MSPTLMPAIVTAWPWPGVTAWAEVNSALSSNRSSPRIGTQDGSALRLVAEDDEGRDQRRRRSAPMIARKSRRCSRIARLMAPPPGSAGPGAASGPVQVGDRVACGRRRRSLYGGFGPSAGWVAERRRLGVAVEGRRSRRTRRPGPAC